MQRVQTTAVAVLMRNGITSAHAESTTPIEGLNYIPQDHLCACREYLVPFLDCCPVAGSPLRMQRVLNDDDGATHWLGITSAHAESTSHRSWGLSQ